MRIPEIGDKVKTFDGKQGEIIDFRSEFHVIIKTEDGKTSMYSIGLFELL